MAYATTTTVSSAQSRAELETILSRYGASHFGYTSGPDSASVVFIKDGVTIRFTLPMPDRNSPEFTRSPDRGLERSKSTAEKAYEQAVRSKWRALLLVVKAKLEAVDSGISVFEQEFYPQIVLPTGRTVYEQTSEDVARAIQTGSTTLRLSIQA